MMRLTPQIRSTILNGTSPERKHICEKTFLGFAMYYFSEYFFYDPAPFHLDFSEDIEDLSNGIIPSTAWVGFKECAKTSFAKMFLTWLIAYKKRKYTIWDAYELDSAKSSLFDVTVALQTNKRLIYDFGQLYTEERSKEEKKMKRVEQFVTTNGYMVRASSTQKSPRGWVYKNHRPDSYFGDDLENFKTIRSIPITQKIIAHLDEIRTGLAPDALELYLGNYISDQGVVQYVMDSVRRSGGRVRFVPAIYKKRPTWPGKYVMTDTEAVTENKERMKRDMKPKISLERKRRDLGETVFEGEMMLNPESSDELFFNRGKIEQRIKELEERNQEPENLAEFYAWDKYNPRHRYGLGGDTAEGIGRDSNASCLIDFSTTPCRQIGSFASSTLAPDDFAYELKREGDMFGTCIVAPENNNKTGGVTIQALKQIYPIEKIFVHRRTQTGKVLVKEKQNNILGWEANVATLAEAAAQFRSAIQDGTLEINDVRILEEAKAYRRQNLYMVQKNPLATRHFDLLRAAMIAWAMRDYAEPAKPKTIWRPPIEPLREFETPMGMNEENDIELPGGKKAHWNPVWEEPTPEKREFDPGE